MSQESNTNTNTADNANGQEAGNSNAKKSKLRKAGGYALKGAALAAVGTGLYFGIRALLGSTGEAAADVIEGAVAAV